MGDVHMKKNIIVKVVEKADKVVAVFRYEDAAGDAVGFGGCTLRKSHLREDWELLRETFPREAMDALEPYTISTLSELADFINAHEDWETCTSEIIERNGWHDTMGMYWGICDDGHERCELDETGRAVVVPIN